MPMAARATVNPINPSGSPRGLGAVVPDPILVAAVTNIEKKITITPTIETTGKIIDIKLAIYPNFLPDSSDNLQPSDFISGILGISFSL